MSDIECDVTVVGGQGQGECQGECWDYGCYDVDQDKDKDNGEEVEEGVGEVDGVEAVIFLPISLRFIGD